LNPAAIPARVGNVIKTGGLKHWKTGQPLTVNGDFVETHVDGKTIDIYCR
jgi:hypothetical protein